jgi:hypothetical protein
MDAAHTAVERCTPICPRCGWQLLGPDDVHKLPAIAWVAVVCAGCEWRGHAKFWTRQVDEPS